MKEEKENESYGRKDGLSILTKYSHLPAERIHYYADVEVSALQNIERGIFFVIAFWSGPAAKAFTQLTDVLSQLDPEGKLDVTVVDTDGTSKLADHPEIYRRLHGWGETFWVRNGVLQSFAGKERSSEQIVTWTKTLLEMA